MENLPLVVNLLMMALSGAFGAGVVWASLRLTIDYFKKDFAKSCEENTEAHAKIMQSFQEAHAELVRSNQEVHNDIRRRQSSLRGELNGSKSVYLPREEFVDKYTLCGEFKHNTFDALAEIKARNIQKDQNWIELKYILRHIAKELKIEVPETFGR